jgi:hypothetical protein
MAEWPVIDKLVEPGFVEHQVLGMCQLGKHVGMNPLAKTESEQLQPERPVATVGMLFEKMPGQHGQLRGVAVVASRLRVH